MTASARRSPPIWLLVSLAWIGPAVLAALQAYLQGRLGNWRPATWRSLLWEGGDWFLYALLTPAVFWLGQRFPLVRGRLWGRIALHTAASVLLCGAWAGTGTLLRWFVLDPNRAPTVDALVQWFLISLPFGVAVYFAVLAVQHATAWFVAARERETQAARLAAQLAEARLGALRMQLQPHFLLNTLNAITVIVRDRDHATGVRMLEQLGDMLRRVMRADRPQEVPLADELEFTRQYLSIEEMRFSDRLRPVFDVPEALLGALVPEFVLQPLVENAVRHGLARQSTATLLRVEARRAGDDLVLSVVDDGPGPGPGTGTEGVGLGTTRERLATLYGPRATLELSRTAQGGAAATVRIPWRKAEA
ncbi:MAG TPA: histidine kinase [Gemmatimonadales bacterium]|nr:histidine kinase [Gemmatimonadales bacterium]